MQRLPYYLSDWTDAVNPKCLTSIVFVFFAAFAPSLTFGGLLGWFASVFCVIDCPPVQAHTLAV